MESYLLFKKSKEIVPGGVHSPVRAFRSVGGDPIFFKKAEGAYLEDVEGKRYVDFCLSFGPLLLGHRNQEVQSKVLEMIQTAWTFGACEPYSLALAEWITKRVSFIDRIRFTTSGTEAVMTALRLARAFTGRQKILKFNGCYHGHVDSMLVKSGSGLAGLASSDSAGVTEQMVQDTLVCDLDDSQTLRQIFATQSKQIAAVIVEPLPANYGMLCQREEFIREIATLAKQHGVLLIFDEVISGFRVGIQGVAGKLGIAPDLVTYGKVIGGGFPVGAYGGRAEIMDLVAPLGPVYQAGTLSANPVGAVAGLATLEIAERENVYQVLEQRAAKWASALNRAWEQKDLPFVVQQEASLFWIHPRVAAPIRTIAQIPEHHKATYARFFHRLTELGIYLAPSGFEVGFLSLAHTSELLQGTIPAFVEAAEVAYRESRKR